MYSNTPLIGTPLLTNESAPIREVVICVRSSAKRIHGTCSKYLCLSPVFSSLETVFKNTILYCWAVMAEWLAHQ